MNLNQEVVFPKFLKFNVPLIISRLLFAPAFAGIIAGAGIYVVGIYLFITAYLVPEGGWFMFGVIACIMYGSLFLMCGATTMYASIFIQQQLMKHNPGFRPKRANIIYAIPSAIVAIYFVISLYLMWSKNN